MKSFSDDIEAVGAFDNGSGHLWQTLDGKIHRMRCDDMGDLVTCDTCRGSGCSEECSECSDNQDEDYWP